MVDSVEGMAPRTHQVFREAYTNQLVPILVINKVDRLCTDLCLTPTEAYMRLRNLLETANAAASAVLTSAQNENDKVTEEEQEKKEQLWTFDPAKNNVIFASALFGWGFTAQSIARALFRQKITLIKPIQLKQFIFGDYKLKDEKVLKWKPDSGDQSIFAEYALQPIWTIYEGVSTAASSLGVSSKNFEDRKDGSTYAGVMKEGKIRADSPGMQQVIEALSGGGTGKEMLSNKEDVQAVLTRTGSNSEDAVLRCLLRRFRPLADTVLDTVCEYAPSPADAASSARSRILTLRPADIPNEMYNYIQSCVASCDASPEAPVVAYVCNFMGVDRAQVRDPHISEDQRTLILGLTRVLSGTLRCDVDYFMIGPKHSASSPLRKQSIRLYLLMGSSFIRVNEVPAGNLCAVYNLEDIQLKTVTISNSEKCMPVTGLENRIRPLVKVNVEAESAADNDDLERGLMRLSLADSAVEVIATAKGELILACLGELHLEQSLLDLRKVYCGREIPLRISDPLIDFGETTDWFENELDYVHFIDNPLPPLRQTLIPPYNEEEGLGQANLGRTRALTSGRSVAISIRVLPLDSVVFECILAKKILDDSEEELIKLGHGLGMKQNGAASSSKLLLDEIISSVCSIHQSTCSVLLQSPGLTDGSCVFGVNNDEVHTESSGDCTEALHVYESLLARIREPFSVEVERPEDTANVHETARMIWTETLQGSTVAGFQMALRSGPICEEPMRNILVVLEGAEVALTRNNGTLEPSKLLSGGMVVSAVRSGIRAALLTRPARLMERYFKLTLHSSLHGIGALYSVISKRRGKVIDDSMVDGTDLLMITALIPQAEAFGLAPEIYGKTSGEVTAPEMVFSHWERLDIDPFWIPTSLEEIEDFGELQDAGDMSTGIDNTALKYIRQVRQQKGLVADSSRTILSAEKQRTLKR